MTTINFFRNFDVIIHSTALLPRRIGCSAVTVWYRKLFLQMNTERVWN